MSWMCVGLMISCLVVAAALLHTHTRETWLAAIALPASAIVGFVLTRTTGLPQAWHSRTGSHPPPPANRPSPQSASAARRATATTPRERGPQLAGGVELEEFRGVHAHGLIPPDVVTDRDFAALNASLQTLPRGARR